MAITLKLKKPVTNGAEKISELIFQDPDGADIMESGIPYDVEIVGKDRQIVHQNAAACGILASRMTNLPPSVIGQLCPHDFMAAMRIVVGFFGDETES